MIVRFPSCSLSLLNAEKKEMLENINITNTKKLETLPNKFL